MYLKSLTIQGFKSFPDKTVLTFGPGITAVVGPNGSGKSNISDAIRWVLGEMSVKSLRGGRMEDVIFGGTPVRRPLGYAEVSLTVDNSDHALPVESEEVTVTRRYYRSGESEYRLGGAQVRLRDIYELFMDTGLGHDGYAVISQGRIAEIVGARSEDRREIFEEAAGIAKFRFRKEEAERRLAATEENLLRLRDILGELEARVGPLKEQAEKARRYLTLAEEKRTLEVGLWLHTLDIRREELRAGETRLEIARARHGELEQKLDTLERTIDEAYMQGQKAAAEADHLRGEAAAREQEAVQCEAQAALCEGDAARADRTRAEVEEERARNERAGSEDESGLAALRAELQEKQNVLAGLRETLEACERDALALTEEGDAQAAATREASARLAQVRASLAGLGQRKSAAQAAAESAAARVEEIGLSAADREQRREQAKALLADAQARLAKARETVQGFQNAVQGCALKQETRREKLAKEQERVRALSLRAGERAQRAAMLAEMEKNLEGFAHSVKLVVREGRRGSLRGVLGPVSQLISAPAEVAVAVETALGASAQHIVVENEANAKDAIRFLQRAEGGRATFLPLTSVRGGLLDVREIARCAGYVGVAAELVSFEERFRDVAENLLGRTVVARDLDTAVEIAKRFHYRFRIVTLDGQQVNAGGSLTGGSRRAGAGLVSRQAEITKLEGEARALQTQLAEAEQAERRAKESLAAAEAEANGARGEWTQAKEAAIRLEGEERRLTEQADLLGADMRSLEDERRACMEKSAALHEQVRTVEEQLEACGQEAEQAEQALSACGAAGEALSARREEQTARLTDLRLKQLGGEKDVQAIAQRIEALEAHRGEKQALVETLVLRIRALEEEARDARERAEAQTAQAQGLREKAAACRREAERRAGEREELERRTVELRAGSRALSEEKENMSRELARLEERKVTLQTSYDALIAKLWEEYELTRSQAEKEVPRVEHPDEAEKRLNLLRHEIKALGSVNLAAIDEYREVEERYTFMKEQTDDVERSKAELETLIRGLTGEMRAQFSKKFAEINGHFASIFVELFGGGRAWLELTDPQDVLACGIEIHVQPPGKIIKNLASLSGGEQAFVAIALYFALLKVRPSPFCVLDEIEAALDEQNVVRYASYLRRLCGSTQFIVITHRRGTMDEADVLYGVTMQDQGVSKLLTLHLDELMERLGLEQKRV